jgi:glycosyltransferase involved in cell wall biosynthesis
VRVPSLVELRIESFNELMRLSDRVIATCDWVRELLLKNGVPTAKIARCHYGIPGGPRIARLLDPGGGLRLVFLGRLSPEKGLHVVLEALRRLPGAAVTLDVFAVGQSERNAYDRKILALIEGDHRVRLRDPVPSGEVVRVLSEYDALVAPSHWLETGPLVVLEAFAAGIPVIGSRLGGIAELARENVDALLVEPGSVGAWRDAAAVPTCAPPMVSRPAPLK